MYGALIGDVIGSFWEFSGNKDPDIPLWIPACRFTDDSVCTAAVAGWLMDGGSIEAHLHATGRKYPKAGWGGNMLAWLQNDTPTPYASWGNGSAMRVAPVALWTAQEDELLDLARQSALPTHGSEAGDPWRPGLCDGAAMGHGWDARAGHPATGRRTLWLWWTGNTGS